MLFSVFLSLLTAANAQTIPSARTEQVTVYFLGVEWQGESRQTFRETVLPLQEKWGSKATFQILDADLKADLAVANHLGMNLSSHALFRRAVLPTYPIIAIYQGDRRLLMISSFISEKDLEPVVDAAVSKPTFVVNDGKIPFTITDWLNVGIKIVSASYGKYDITEKLSAFCNYKKKCGFKAALPFMFDDPSVIEAKSVALQVKYVCLNHADQELSADLPRPAQDQLLILECAGGKK